jgi:hypothetical protein
VFTAVRVRIVGRHERQVADDANREHDSEPEYPRTTAIGGPHSGPGLSDAEGVGVPVAPATRTDNGVT